MNSNYVAVDLTVLDREVSGAIGAAWSDTTLKTRNSQWKKYIEFCHDNDIQAMPASHETVTRFLVFLARTCKFSTVNNYSSAVNRLHLFYGYKIDFRDSFLIKLVLAGIKRQLGDFSAQKNSSPLQMLCIYKLLDMSDIRIATMWCALMFSFRTLLRKSNVVPDTLEGIGHVVDRRDVVMEPDQLVVKVRSSKTIQYQERILEIPLQKVDEPAFCVYTLHQIINYLKDKIGVVFFRCCVIFDTL